MRGRIFAIIAENTLSANLPSAQEWGLRAHVASSLSATCAWSPPTRSPRRQMVSYAAPIRVQDRLTGCEEGSGGLVELGVAHRARPGSTSSRSTFQTLPIYVSAV